VVELSIQSNLMFLCSFALDQICCLPREHVQETKITFRWLVWVAPVCGDHTQQAPRTGDQWCRLHGANTGLAISFEVLSLSLADLGGVCEGVLHALPDVLRNFDTVSARP
jgi:hypothetical protein